jgi:hypothetical protein
MLAQAEALRFVLGMWPAQVSTGATAENFRGSLQSLQGNSGIITLNYVTTASFQIHYSPLYDHSTLHSLSSGQCRQINFKYKYVKSRSESGMAQSV